MIRIEHLNKFFNRGKQNEIHVINDISLDLPDCGMVAIFGKSGCGKTTLLNVIGGLDRFSGGSLSVNGQDIREDTDALRNREMGYIFQNYNLCRDVSCYDNVANALRLCGMKDGPEMRERVEAALANVGMKGFENRTPDSLSGGQQQRIAIARAIVKNPRIILADEPTGNLDEANTVLVMDLLREIARDHLVLLVTHEEDLVDHYCETVIELSDGKAVSIRGNVAANGLRVRDKNDVWLGELEKHDETDDGRVSVTYYGEKPASPVRIRVVNNGGKFYLQVDTAGVQVLDDTCEVRLREGVFEAHGETVRDSERVNMEKLPPITGTRYGRLYTLPSALRSGWRANFGKSRKGKKFLLVLMTLFSAVLVLMTSIFGTSIRTLRNAKTAHSKNTFYLYTPSDGEVSEKLLAALADPDNPIDDIQLIQGYGTRGDSTYQFKTGFFNTFNYVYGRSDVIEGHAVLLDRSCADGKKLVAGKQTDLGRQDLLISTAMADLLLKASTVGYLRSYDDLIGLYSTSLSVTDPSTGANRMLAIAGVVESSESALYADPLAIAKTNLSRFSLPLVLPITAGYEKVLTPGTVTVWSDNTVPVEKLPQAGEKIFLRGMEFTVSETVIFKQPDKEDPNAGSSLWGTNLLVCEEDYIALSRRDGKTDPRFSESDGYYGEAYDDRGFASSSYYAASRFSVIHSADPRATEAWLKSTFADLKGQAVGGGVYADTLYTPDTLYKSELVDTRAAIVSSFISMAVIVGILCVCIYFIMRSSLMKGIREIGIYRAIGVTRKNLLFRFFIESAVLTALTTVIGFLLSGTVMRLWLRTTPLMENLFYYPLWLAGALLVLLVGVCLLCGVLPALTLLRKTPSEILAKYDI